MNIENSVIFITGANRGIGKAYVEAFLAAGAAKIYLGVRKPESVSEMVAQNSDRLIPLKLDVTNESDIKAAAEEAQDITILVNNAGILFFDDVHSADAIDHARKQMEVNYFGVLAMTQAFAPILKANGGGVIVNLSSIVGHVTMPAITTYCASKYAVQSLILASRASLAAQGTQVIGVYPGPIDTDMAHDLEMDKFPPEQVAKETLKAIESSTEDVFTDPFSQSLYQQFRTDPKAVEAQMKEMAQEDQEAA